MGSQREAVAPFFSHTLFRSPLLITYLPSFHTSELRTVKLFKARKDPGTPPPYRRTLQLLRGKL